MTNFTRARLRVVVLPCSEPPVASEKEKLYHLLIKRSRILREESFGEFQTERGVPETGNRGRLHNTGRCRVNIFSDKNSWDTLTETVSP